MLNRIRNSSATVSGIAGLRGAGKSSLAMRVLDKCEKEDQAFTLLVHSPTSYEPKEFLISVFQRCCEDVVRRVDTIMGQAETLQDRGREEVKHYSRKLWAFAAGLLVVLVAIIWFVFDAYQDEQVARFAEEVSHQKQQFQIEIDDLNQMLRQQVAVLYREFFDDGKNLPNDLEDLSELRRYARTPEAHNLLSSTGRKEFQDRFDELIIPLERRMLDLVQSRAQLDTAVARDRIAISFNLIIQFALVIGLYFFLFLAGWQIIRIRSLRKVAKKYPLENGLRAAAHDLLETLQFQSKTTTSAEAKLGISKFTGSLGHQRSLEARPLSLPGLTAEFGHFLEQVSEVYNGKVVICLDELDKIEDLDDLSSLLRSVKGVLGHKNTHFLLTVSEDALARYSTRRRMERGMLESSFESIVFLDRVTPETAMNILKAMGILAGEDPEDAKRAFVVWVSAAGIPREIKRGAVSVRQLRVSLSETPALDIWLWLMRDKLEDLGLWGKRLHLPEDKVFGFFTLLQRVEALLADTPALESPVLRQVWASCRMYEDSVLELLQNPDAEMPGDQAERFYALVRACLEIRLEIFSFQALSQFDPANVDAIKQMLGIFDAIPANVLFARELLDKIEEAVTGQSTAAATPRPGAEVGGVQHADP